MKGLVAVAVIWAALAVLWAATVGVPSAGGQEALPEQSPLTTACAAMTNLAGAEHLSVTRCRRVAEIVEGNTALVTVKVWVAGQGTFTGSFVFYRSVWTQTAVRITAP